MIHQEREMAISTFDTLKYVRRLEQVGVPTEQAEAQAEVLTEAFNVNLEQLVTKEYLNARLAEFKSEINVTLRAHTVMLTIVLAAVVLPLLERLTAL